MSRRRPALRAAAAVVLVAVVLAPGAALGQEPPDGAPPGSGPPPTGGAPAPGQPGSGPPPDESEEGRIAAQAGAADLTLELALLGRLDAFAEPLPDTVTELLDRLEDANPFASREELVEDLRRADEGGEDALADLIAAGVRIGPSVQTVLVAHDDEAYAAILAGTWTEDPAPYLVALDALVNRGGRQRNDGEPMTGVPLALAGLAAIEADAAGEVPGAPGVATTTTTTPSTTTAPEPTGAALPPPPPAEESDATLLLVAVAAAVVAAVAVGLLLARRRSRGDSVDELLDVSRQLAGAATQADVARIAVSEAVRLTDAMAGALVEVADDGTLGVVQESEGGLLLAERLGEGLLARVVDTAQPIAQVSQTEPAIRNLPVSVIAAPVVGGGRVVAVLLAVRSAREPFQVDEREVLRGLGPVLAASLTSAARAEQAAEDALVDALTGLGNRRALEQDLARSQADEAGVAVVMADLDHFKAVNDAHGHLVGDALLRSVADVVGTAVRPGDAVYRYGGEELCVLLPGTEVADAADVAERIRRAVADDAGAEGADGVAVSVTTSIGVAAGRAHESAGQLLERADRALYEAKRAGRDRVEVAAGD